jgi:hypothetical protein
MTASLPAKQHNQSKRQHYQSQKQHQAAGAASERAYLRIGGKHHRTRVNARDVQVMKDELDEIHDEANEQVNAKLNHMNDAH